MIYVNILGDEDLQEVTDKVLAGVLPNRDFDVSLFTDTYKFITKFIRLEEFSGEYYILLYLLNELNSFRVVSKSYIPLLKREQLDFLLKSKMPSILQDKNVRVEEVLEFEGYTGSLEIQSNKSIAKQILYQRTINLFDRVIEQNLTSADAMTYLPAYKEIALRHITTQSVRAQATILKDKLKVGRKTYSGADGILSYMNTLITELDARNSDDDSTIDWIDSMEKSNLLAEEAKKDFMPLAKYGIPPLDDLVPILRHRLVVLVAPENTGKTKIACDLVNNITLAGHKVVFMCGETTKSKNYAQLISNYIYKKHNQCIPVSMLGGKYKLPPDKQKIYNIARSETVDSKSFGQAGVFNAYTIYDTLKEEYEKCPFDAVILDHMAALIGEGTEYDRVTEAARQLRRFKNDYPVYILALSHPSTAMKEALAKDKEVTNSPTRSSSVLSAEADDIFILHSTKLLQKENLVALDNYKLRDEGKYTDTIFLTTKFDVSSFFYEEDKQKNISVTSEDADKIVNDLQDTYNDDEGDFIDDEGGF